jgi:hypothetical protein
LHQQEFDQRTRLILILFFERVVFSAAIAITAVVLVARYGPLGWGLSALLALIGVLALAATLPVGLWGPWRARETHGEP